MGDLRPTTEAWPPTADIQTTKCAAGFWDHGPGTGHQALSKLTGGLRFPICSYANFDVVFNAIATDVVRNVEMQCDVPLDPQQEAMVRKLMKADLLSETLKIAELFGYSLFYRPQLFWFVYQLPQIFWRLPKATG